MTDTATVMYEGGGSPVREDLVGERICLSSERSATGLPASVCQITYTICSSENVDRFIGPSLTPGIAEAVIPL